MLKIVGFGSGSKENMTLEAVRAIQDSELVVGFRTYVELLKQYFPDKQYYSTNMMQERERCQYAIDRAKEGKETVLVCSGDSGVYGMASLVYELAEESVQIQVISGVTAANRTIFFMLIVPDTLSVLPFSRQSPLSGCFRYRQS